MLARVACLHVCLHACERACIKALTHADSQCVLDWRVHGLQEVACIGWGVWCGCSWTRGLGCTPIAQTRRPTSPIIQTCTHHTIAPGGRMAAGGGETDSQSVCDTGPATRCALSVRDVCVAVMREATTHLGGLLLSQRSPGQAGGAKRAGSRLLERPHPYGRPSRCTSGACSSIVLL